MSTGVDAFLIKPFNKRELLVRIDNLLSLRLRLREKYSQANVIEPSELEVSSVDQRFLKKVLCYIEDNMGDIALGVDDLASAVSMSESQLNRKLNSLIGKSPGKLIRSLRLQRASEYIQKNAGNMSEIAFICGFSDISSFHRSFKREYGVAPSKFKLQGENTYTGN